MSNIHKFISKQTLKPYLMIEGKDGKTYRDYFLTFNNSYGKTYSNEEMKKLMFKDNTITKKDMHMIDDLFGIHLNQYNAFNFKEENYIILKSLKNISKISYQLIMFKMNRLFDEIHSKNVKRTLTIDW